jgi:hypothetical protein
MSDIKTWMKGIETLEPPERWGPREPRMPLPEEHRTRRIGTIVVAAVLAVAATAFAVIALRPGPVHRMPATAIAEAHLRTIAMRIARPNGDRSPDLVVWGLVAVAQADSLVGLEPNPGDQSRREYVVVLEGHFVCTICKGFTDRQPRSPAIVVTVDPAKWEVSDFSFGPVPDVSRLHLQTLEPFGSTEKSDDVPWTFPVPSGWTVSSGRSAPDPNLKTGVLETWATSAPYRLSFGHSPSPNGRAGASEALGRDAVVVQIELLWYPPDQNPAWSPSTSPTQIGIPTEWHSDAQNPGWEFRERRVCRRDACVQVLEWHGPDASDAAIGLAQTVAELMDLKATWSKAISGSKP